MNPRLLPVLLLLVCLYGSKIGEAQSQTNLLPATPMPQSGTIVGTVVDVHGDTVPGATVSLQSPSLQHAVTVVTNNSGFYQFNGVKAGTYRVSVDATGFASWTSPAIILHAGQYAILKGSQLNVAKARTTVTVTPESSEEIARKQVKVEEQQRVLGIIPNYYVVYDHNPAPLPTHLKFELATKVLFDPVTMLGTAAVAGFDQAGAVPGYQEGAKGYGQRLGATYTGAATDIMIGGAILPSLLHQDPRYYYQGTGSKTSRALHAISRAFVTTGDDGRSQPNYSTIGGDLAAAAIATAYYPPSDRSAGKVFGTALINTGERMVGNLAQEFFFRKLSSKPKPQE